LTGVGVSPGIAVGPAFIVRWSLPDVPQRVVPEGEVDLEIERLRTAVNAVRAHILELRARTEDRAGAEEARIFEAQIMMLEDQDFMGAVERLIRENRISAERAFEFKTLELRALWTRSESALLQQRRADLFGIGVRVLGRLLGHSIEETLQRGGGRPVVVLTRELTPGLTVEFDRQTVAGFASAEGTRTSHAAILAHSLGIPCVMGFGAGLDRVTEGADVVLDGSRGWILLDPTGEEVDEALAFEKRRGTLLREMERVEREPARTLDGVQISLRSNLDLPEELEEAVAHGADGVGLLRTEFLVLGRTELPSEDEQAGYFERIARRFPGHPIVVRSYDLGGDKFPAPFSPPREPNPFLGWRAIRVCLDQPEIFRPQLRAIMRARAHGDVQLMLPLVTQVEEVVRVRELVEEEVADLKRLGIAYGPDLPVGVMVETPAAVILADELASRSDFLSVGTNDLTQYTLAVDRGNAGIAGRFSSFHPAVVRSLRAIAEAGDRAGLRVSVCGEMASDPLSALLLLSLGYTVFSVAPPRLPLVRWVLRQIDASAVVRAAPDVVKAETRQEVKRILTETIAAYMDLDLLDAGRLPDVRAPTSFKT
jgi:phosphotransferase system enzyme I (PtsI)